MHFKALLTSLLLIHLLSAECQIPSWTEYAQRESKYPDSDYIKGFTSENNTSQQEEGLFLQKLTGYAKGQLVENISVQVNSVTTLNVQNMNAQTHEEFKQMSVSFAGATIAGLSTETYYDKKKNIGYVFAYAKISEVITYYGNEINRLLGNLTSQYELVKSGKTSGNNESALQPLLRMQTVIHEIESAQTILVTLSGKFDLPQVKRIEVDQWKLTTQKELNALKSMNQASVEDAAFFIATAIATQNPPTKKIQVANFTYQDTPMGSSFSRRLQSALEQKMVQQGFQVAGQGTADALILKGTYWDEEGRVKITAILRDATTSTSIASADAFLPKQKILDMGLATEPENYKDALVNMKELAQNEIKGGELVLDLYTNKGKDNLIFTEGDMMKLFVRANRECYLRFVYHLADGSKVLLLDNYYINRENVNQTYELPYEFECAEPFGAETLQANAQSTPFEPLATKSEYGYDFIVDTNQTVLTKTRGMKNPGSSTLKAEKRLVLTTMSR